MKVPKVTARTNGLVVLVALVGLVFGSAGPAIAQDEPTVGAGAGTGWEYARSNPEPAGPDPCATETPPSGEAWSSATFVLTHNASTYDSVDPGGPTIASYVGPTQMTITIGPFVASPQGAAPGTCESAVYVAGVLVPGPVPIVDAEVTGQFTVDGVTGSVDCQMTVSNGFYTRVNSTVAFTFVVECDIMGNVVPGSVTNVPVRHWVEGQQTPCLPSPPFVPTNCDLLNETVNPDPSGQGTSHMTTTFEAYGPSPPL